MHYLPAILTPIGYVFVNTKASSVMLVSTEKSNELKPTVRSKQSTREALANRDKGIWLDCVGDGEYMLTSLP